jgi:hypothetical protein
MVDSGQLNDLRLRVGTDATRFSLNTRMIQLSTVASRPTPGQWLYDRCTTGGHGRQKRARLERRQ